MRVLVVEDHPRLAETVATVLRREGMAVDVAFDGREALDRASLTTYDVVVLDRDLPGVHGDEVCRSLVADGLPERGVDADRRREARGPRRGPRHRRRRLPPQAVSPRRAGRTDPCPLASLADRPAADARARRPAARLRAPGRHPGRPARWRSAPRSSPCWSCCSARRARSSPPRRSSRGPGTTRSTRSPTPSG